MIYIDGSGCSEQFYVLSRDRDNWAHQVVTQVKHFIIWINKRSINRVNVMKLGSLCILGGGKQPLLLRHQTFLRMSYRANT